MEASSIATAHRAVIPGLGVVTCADKSHHLYALVPSLTHGGVIKPYTGIQRCGKSTLLFDLFNNYLIERNGVADATVLRETQCHPENYRGLPVRVSGWNARFVTLDKEWQNMVIDQIENSTHL